MQSQNKNEMFAVSNDYHTLLWKAGLKAAPERTFFFLKNVKFLGHVISPDGIQNTVVLRLIILIHSFCFALALDKATNYDSSSIFSLFTHVFLLFGTH